jgi:tRNA (cytidine32/uridine32-2'-O)-methyltransferase
MLRKPLKQTKLLLIMIPSMNSPSALNNISIVLVNTKTPANVGAVSRCMMNMGLSRLILVQPPADRNNEAMKLAAGAEEILQSAARFETLREAVSDHGLVVGTSRHTSRHRKNVHTPRQMAEQVLSFLSFNKVAIVFGREVNGLDNEDVALCHELVAIPSSDAFPSLNLSHAVMVVAYELFIAAQAKHPPSELILAPVEELENFYEHLQKTLQDIGFIDRVRPEHMMFSLRQIFGRARLDSRDASILRGILSEIERAAKAKG